MTSRESERSPIAPLEARHVVFISHANPEDNAATSWYGARLALAGYEVWTDLTRLLGGEEMWSDIDNALRFNVRKVVVLLSRAASSDAKEGLRAELIRAEAYRKKLKDRRFIIPIRIDDVPFEDLPPTIANRTVFDASKNPAAGLARILEILEKDAVRRDTSGSTVSLSRWQRFVGRDVASAEKPGEVLISNWHRVQELPTHMNLFSIERPLSNAQSEPAQIASRHPFPMSAHLRYLMCAAPVADAQEAIASSTPIKLHKRMPLEQFLAGGDDDSPIAPFEARKHLVSLLRQGFDSLAMSRGWQPFNLSETTKVWWVPESATSDPRVHFVRPSGVGGWRKLTGVYGARKKLWHFGLAARPVADDHIRVALVPHIVFSDPTGEEPLTAEHRRAMCKFWFNAKWRDLLLAATTTLSTDGELVLPLGGKVVVRVDSVPLLLDHPVRVPIVLDRKTGRKVLHDEGDTEDLDDTERENDPAFGRGMDEHDAPKEDL